MFNFFKKDNTNKPAEGSTIKEWSRLANQEIGIRKLNCVIADTGSEAKVTEVARIQLEAMNLGFVFSKEAASAVATDKNLESEVFPILQSLVGGNKAWSPFYSNFPQQVREISDVELFFNSIAHYWTRGEWKPHYNKESRLPLYEATKFKEVGLTKRKSLLEIFRSLLSARSSLPELDYQVIYSILQEFNEAELVPFIPNEIEFKETKCMFIAFTLMLEMSELSNVEIREANDLLRIASALSGGDVSLTENTKFKLKRRHRKWLVGKLEKVVSEEDVKRHANKWKRLFHCLHIGSYLDAPKTNEIASRLRNSKLKGTNTKIESALLKQDFSLLMEILMQRPGDFARRLDHLLRIFSIARAKEVVTNFKCVVDQVDSKVLVQLLSHLKYRIVNQRAHALHGRSLSKHVRVAIPKGQIANVKVLRNSLYDISPNILKDVIEIVEKSLRVRFALKQALGKVWIDPELKRSPVPLQMRNAPEGLLTLQRGSRLPMGEKNTLRFFVHWIGLDIDLSAAFLTEELKFHSDIAYYNLRNQGDGYKSVHSGDITDAPHPDGACEFIDIDLASINDPEIRYIAMDVRVYEGPPFPVQEANVGWMMRDSLGNPGEVFDARTVEQRISISATSRTCLVAIFDIKKREVIWTDLIGSSNYLRGPNNLVNSRFNIEELLDASLNFKQMSIYELLKLHAEARGELVESEEKAGTVFGRDLVHDYGKILSEYL